MLVTLAVHRHLDTGDGAMHVERRNQTLLCVNHDQLKMCEWDRLTKIKLTCY